ncbi:translocation and assembly module lipoprotein TamL [Flavobacterium undicola]|uniref:translocation and assembly module lipoprotein TamL n=1 Tax=Flavobacterium undicola TaxID=1932779 RepID=UPI001376DFD6|nr:BamA/TamA family outer membrane protein [Flavobacterium undicola]MBA0883460.1 BamA/TamA family outer membrane protein [Flavobacterium undicola]
MKTLNHYLLFFSVLLMASSCSNTRQLPEGELLYVGGKVKVIDTAISRHERKLLQKELKPLLRPKPNSKIAGMRIKLFLYNLAGEPKKTKGFRHWLRTKAGEPPVLFSQVDLDYNTRLLQNYSQNRGYFKATASADSTRRNKRATAEYITKPGKQYHIKEIKFPTDSSALGKAIAATRDKTLFKEGDGYSLDVVKAERIRIDGQLKEQGYYYFGPDYLKVQIDSTIGKYQTDLIVKVKEETPKQAKQVFTINKIMVYPNYSIKDNNRYLKKMEKDTTAVLSYHDFTIVDKDKLFNPRIFDHTLYFYKGDLYNRTAHNLSLNRLVNLGTFKFVKNQFVLSDSLGTALDAYYYLTPLKKKSIRVEVLGKTNSANYTGTELNVNWSNRNTFKGAELFTVSIFSGLEVQMSGQNNGFNVYRVGSEVNMIWPRFIAPFRLHSSSGFMPKTKATLGYEFQKRVHLYALNSFKGSFGYLWKENIRKEHQLNITDINYVSPNNVTALYREQMAADPTLAKVIEKQLVFGPTYSYTYTNTMETNRKHTLYYKASVYLAGTLAGILSSANVKQGDTTKVFGVAFSQYVKIENDFRHYMKLGIDSQLASRIMFGVGYGYGNSTELPYIKQFFIGGTNSIRAFRARSIGPGSFLNETESSFLPDQSGDIKLELNTEYRVKLFNIVKGAVFVDAGNIWLMHKNPNKPGAEFSKKFLDQMAVGTGMGLRFDFSFLLLRTDLAFPLRKPYLEEGQRWVIDQINFGSGSWRKENLIFNLAIGYPF